MTKDSGRDSQTLDLVPAIGELINDLPRQTRCPPSALVLVVESITSPFLSLTLDTETYLNPEFLPPYQFCDGHPPIGKLSTWSVCRSFNSLGACSSFQASIFYSSAFAQFATGLPHEFRLKISSP